MRLRTEGIISEGEVVKEIQIGQFICTPKMRQVLLGKLDYGSLSLKEGIALGWILGSMNQAAVHALDRQASLVNGGEHARRWNFSNLAIATMIRDLA